MAQLNQISPEQIEAASGAADERESALAPTHPYLEGIHAPLAEEFTLESLEIVGTLPAALDGRYLRIGPNPADPHPESYHWFVGDGMVHALSLKGGEATWYRNRWVRSARVAEALGELPAPGPRHSPSDTVNTNVTAIGGATYALVEGGSTPVRLSHDLEEQAFSDFGGTLRDAFAAHPHRDPVTGEQHAITYNARNPHVVHHVVLDDTGRVVRELPIPVEHGPSIHDCAFTARFVVILDLPVTLSMAAARSGQVFPFRWNPAHRARVGLLPRAGVAAEIIWCEVPPAYAFHAMNAYDAEDGRVVVDLVAYDRMFDGAPDGPNEAPRGLERWIVDPVGRGVEIRTLDPAPQEFPRPDERFLGRPYRVGFTMALPFREGEQTQAGEGLYRHDLGDGSRQCHSFGEGRHPGEFVFVPRSPDAPEGDGWLVGLVLDSNVDRSEFVVLDTLDFEGEPVARVLLPHRIPPGFHGNWIDRAVA